LIEKYGVPSDQDEKRTPNDATTLERSVFWRMPSTSLTLHAMTFFDHNGSVSIDYRKVVKSPL
jgi:hypothetical protein